MKWQLPNQLTVGRIALAALFFVLLGMYDAAGAERPMLMNAALAVYVVAGITDVLDGHLARLWKITSAFGRIVDPFVDKVLVVGAFAMLASSNFTMGPATSQWERDLPWWLTGHMASAVQGWMVVVVMSREFIVSAVRGYSESQGVKFPATPAGKIKMFVQSAAICTILIQLGNLPDAPWAVVVKISLVWLSVLITVLSGLAYVGKARKVLSSDE
jgi:CDP-diacylglycerol--glycerol-3-phosphate 3-phosphatidyltransferase